jgi:NAD(P)-dependent dehydrogenase (short-subunit alcohol dehydrogenase family)
MPLIGASISPMINFEQTELDRRDFLSLGILGGAAGMLFPLLPGTAEAASGKNGATGQPNWKETKVWITGGTSGLGRVLVETLAKRGSQVAFCGRKPDGGKEVEKSIKGAPGKVKYYVADVTKENEVRDFVKGASEWMGRIDLAINNAGIDHVSENFVEESLEESLKVIQTNLVGTMICLKYIGQQMKKQKSGSIINLGSVAGVRGSQSGIAYSASKHGVVGLTKSLARNLGPIGIRVNCVSPYIMDNLMGQGRIDKNHEEIQNSLQKMFLPRIITVENVAEAILWLGSDQAWNITGQNLVIDGGHLS